jgi:hypothetical protein
MGNSFDEAAEELRKEKEDKVRAEAEKSAAIREAASKLAHSVNNSKYIRETNPEVQAHLERENTVVITQNNKELRVNATDTNKFVCSDRSFPFQGDENAAAKGIINWLQTP